MHAIGLDIGGSKTHAVSWLTTTLVSPPLVESWAGSANLASVSEADAGAAIDAALAGLAAQGHEGTPAHVVAGAAGADSPAMVERLHALLADRLPGSTITVVHDTELILAAAGVRDGIAVISGTGAVAWGRTETGLVSRAGGWGYLLGDEGSGYHIALGAVRHVLALEDLGIEPDALSQRILEACGLASPKSLIEHFYGHPERRYWAKRSEVVFSEALAGNEHALDLVERAADDLTALIMRVRTRLGSPVGQPVVLGGGVLMNQELLRRMITARLAGHGVTDVRALRREPALGALDLATGNTTPTEETAPIPTVVGPHGGDA